MNRVLGVVIESGPPGKGPYGSSGFIRTRIAVAQMVPRREEKSYACVAHQAWVFGRPVRTWYRVHSQYIGSR